MRSENRFATLVLRIRNRGRLLEMRLANRAGSIETEVIECRFQLPDQGLVWAHQILSLIDPSQPPQQIHTKASSLQVLGQELFRNGCPQEISDRIRTCDFEFLAFDLDRQSAQIPWELCHDGTEFLCCRFSTGRLISDWSSPSGSPRPCPAQSGSFLIVSNPTGDLPASSAEGQDLSDFLMIDQNIEATLLNHHVDKRRLLHSMRESELIHFSGHFDRIQGVECQTGWRLADGILTGSDIRDLLRDEARIPSLVFNNSCGSALLDETDRAPFFKGLLECGCLHYIGGLSRVVDHLGREFAKTFYKHVLDRVAVGTALRLARLHLRLVDEEDFCGWAQYILYGDPAKGMYGERANFPEALSLVLIDHDTGHIDSMISEHPGAEKIILESGVVCTVFGLPSDAVRFALSFLRKSRNRIPPHEWGTLPRIAISGGEVSVERSEDSGNAVGIQGLPVVVGLALLETSREGQILTTRPVLNDARANVRRAEIYEHIETAWMDHGLYKHKELEDPIPLCEVGEKGVAPLKPPGDTKKLFRSVSPDQEPVLGWRPALDLEIPTLPEWVLKEKLGEGGFGEVWRAQHVSSDRTRVFKFCFKADRVRSLKREVTLFKILKDRLGPQANIVQIHEVYFDDPPFFISMEYVHGLDLGKWCAAYCGDERVDESVRLELVAKIADALQTAHDAGLIHRDIKPSNVLVSGTPDSVEDIHIKLTDFGIGQVQSTQFLVDVTAMGFSETFSSTEMTSGSGSRLYMAPELLVGKQSSIRSDIYSLGVVLYQMLLGNCDRPLTVDWEGEIEDPILLEDLRILLAGSAGNRFRSAGEVAERLRSVPQRREELIRENRRKTKEDRRRNRLRLMTGLTVVAILVIAALGIGLYQAMVQRERAERQAYYGGINKSHEAIFDKDIALARDILYHLPEKYRAWEWGHDVFLANCDFRTFRGHNFPIVRLALDPKGVHLATGDSSGRVLMRDFETDRSLWEFESAKHPIDSIVFNSDSTLVAVSDKERIKVLEPSTGNILHDLASEQGFAGAVHFVSGEARLVASDSGGDILVYDLDGGSVRTIETGHDSRVPNFAISPDGKKILTGSLDSQIKLFDLASGEVLASTRPEIQGLGHSFGIRDVAFTQGGGHAFVAIDQYTFELDIETFRFWGNRHQFNSNIEDLAISPNQFYLAVKTDSNSIETQVIEDRGGPLKWLDGERGPRSLSFTPDSRYLIAPKLDKSVSKLPITVRPLTDFPLVDHEGFVESLAFRHDGRVLATGTSRIGLWDTKMGELIQMINPDGEMVALGFAPNGNLLAAVTNLGDVLLWDDPPNGEPLKIGDHGQNVLATSLDFSPTDPQFATVGHDGSIKIWGLPEGRLIRVIAAEGERLDAVAYARSGRTLLTGGDSSSVREWDISTGHRIRSFEGHSDRVLAIEFFDEGERFASGGKDQRIRIWEYDSGQSVAELRVKAEEPFALAISPDNRRLMSYEQIWDLETYQSIGKTYPDVKAFSPDGLLLAIGGGQTTSRIIPAFPYAFADWGGDADSLRSRIEEEKIEYWLEREDAFIKYLFPPHRASLAEAAVTYLINFENGTQGRFGEKCLYYRHHPTKGEDPTRFCWNEAVGVPGIKGKRCHLMAFPSRGVAGAYELPTRTSSSFGQNTNVYTLIFDLFYPKESSNRRRVLYNTNLRLEDSPELVISATGGLGFDGVYAGEILPETWHRVACTVDLRDPPTMALYIDGNLVSSIPLPEGLDGRWSIPVATGLTTSICVFSDFDAARTAPGFVSSIQVRNYAMSEGQIWALGDPDASGIPWELNDTYTQKDPAIPKVSGKTRARFFID